MRARNAVGKASAELFVKGLNSLFDKVVVYRSFDSIKNNEEYDYILIPETQVEISYEKEIADRREIFQETESAARLIGTPFGISSAVEYEMQVRDPRDAALIAIFSSAGTPAGKWWTYEAVCGNHDPRNYNRELSEDLQFPIEEAMTDALEKLLMALDAGLQPAARVTHGD